MKRNMLLVIAGRQGVLAPVVFAFALFALDSPLAAAQSCRWDGTSPLCSGKCGGNETDMTHLGAIPDFWVSPFVNQNPPFGANCATGTKALCCSTAGRSCRWDGTAPFCDGGCRSGETPQNPPEGSSGGSACWTGSKVYCCSSTGVTRQPLVAENCSSGPGTCAQGFVWRGAVPNDHVCVTSQVHDQTNSDNTQAAARRSPTGGPFGSDTCLFGFVWREAFSGDHVCVTPQTKSQAAQDNHWSSVRNACP
jgi:hypothetical protein